MGQEEQSEQPAPYPVYGPPYPTYYGAKKTNLWKNPVILMWLAVSGLSLLASIIGFIIIYAEEITAERILAGMFISSVISLIVLIVYWLTFHDFKD